MLGKNTTRSLQTITTEKYQKMYDANIPAQPRCMQNTTNSAQKYKAKENPPVLLSKICQEKIRLNTIVSFAKKKQRYTFNS